MSNQQMKEIQKQLHLKNEEKKYQNTSKARNSPLILKFDPFLTLPLSIYVTTKQKGGTEVDASAAVQHTREPSQ